MGRSLGVPEPVTAPSAPVAHRPSGSALTVAFRDGRMVHRVAERGVTAELPVAIQIGSGIRGRTYAVRIGDYLLESPLSWYKDAGWDVSPGYESLPLLDFDRPLTSNCLFCHANHSRTTDADGRRTGIAAGLAPISCERCHGDATRHLADPSRRTIVNPARLTGPARDSVCEQCHLEGDVRVPNPGKTLTDYQPGQSLEETVATYFLHGSSAGGDRPAVSQFEEFAASRCATQSGGKLWCGTCHNPHGTVDVNRVCQSCHPAPVKATVHASGRGRDCVSCHMPRRSTKDIAHTAVVDHSLQRVPGSAASGNPAAPRVVAWREPPAAVRRRNLALAGLQLGVKDNLPALIDASAKLLDTLPDAQQQSDPEMLAALEVAFLGRATPAKALALSAWAVEASPASATYALNHARALQRAGDPARAIRELERALTLDPSLSEAYAELAVLYDAAGRRAEAVAVIERFLKWNPQSIQFRLVRGQR